MSVPDLPDMDYECRYCGSEDVVPVLDKGIADAPKAGNKYRRHCLSCWRWLPMCSASYFRAHDDPHVLPIEAEAERRNLVPLEEYRQDDSAKIPEDDLRDSGCLTPLEVDEEHDQLTRPSSRIGDGSDDAEEERVLRPHGELPRSDIEMLIAKIISFYEEGEISERAARELLGDALFEATSEKAWAEMMPSSGP